MMSVRKAMESDCKRAEEALYLSDDELVHYFEQPFIGMLTAKHTKGTIHVNQRFCDMVGYTKEDMQSMDWGRLTHPDDLAPNQALLDQAIRGEIDSYQMEKRYLHKDGHIVYVHLAVKCVRDSQGQPDYFIGMMLDISERKHAEEVLLLESKKNEILLRMAGDGIHVLDMDGNVVQVNESFCRMLGYSMQDLQAMNVAQWDAQWYPVELKKILAKMFDGSTTLETVHRRSDGSLIDVEINAVGVTIGGQQLVYCSGRDITARKQADRALRHKEAMLARTEALAKIGSWEWQVKSDTLTWSDELFHIFQRDPTKGAPLFAEQPDLFPEEDMERFRISIENTIEKGQPYEIELRAIHANGDIRHCIARGQAERAGDGVVEWLAGSFQDITERKKMEARLAYDVRVNAALAELSQSMIKPAPNMQEILDTILEVALSLTLSQSGYVSILGSETVYGMSHAKVDAHGINIGVSLDGDGQSVAIRHTPDELFPRLWVLTKNTHKGFFSNQAENLACVDGLPESPVPIRGVLSAPSMIEDQLVGRIVLANPAYDYADHDQAVVGQIAVIYASAIQRKRMEQELIAARDAANASAKAKSDFLANMSHEIRTPMNGILGLTRLALDQPLSPTVRSYLEKVHSSSDSLLGILNDILDYTKIEAGLLAIDEISFDLGEMLETLHNSFSFLAEEKSLALNFEIADDVPRDLHGDGQRLQQVLTNLLGNALKFTETGSVTLAIVFIGMEQDIVRLSFRVADTGIGMSEETVVNLFRPFTQADASITRRFGGTGLGLAISSELLALLGSEFKVESTLGRGTVFKFDLAFKQAEVNQQVHLLRQTKKSRKTGHVKNKDDSNDELTGIRVLVAEDNPINRQVACEFLQRVGIQVGTAGNGYEVLALLRREHFDAVLMDVHMPELNGLETTRLLREEARYNDLPIIALTAGVTETERERALASGMNGFIAKPIDPDDLLDTLMLWIRPRQMKPPSGNLEQQHVRVGNTLQLPEFDLEDLENGLGSQEDVVNLLLQFRLDAMANMEKFEAAIAANELESAEWHMHSLKGASGNVGAMNLFRAAQALDADLKQGFSSADKLESLRSAYRAALVVMDDLQKSGLNSVTQDNCMEEFKLEVANMDRLLTQKYLVTDELMLQLEALTPFDRLDLYRLFKRHVNKIDYKKAREVLFRLAEG